MTLHATPTRPKVGRPRAWSEPTFDLREIPFSRRGCWLNLSPVTGLHRHSETVHLVTHRTGFHPVLALTPVDGEGRAASVRWEASASAFRWRSAQGLVEAAFGEDGALHLRGTGLGLSLVAAAPELTPFSGTYFFVDPVDGDVVLTSYETGRRYRLRLLQGDWEVRGAEGLGDVRREVRVDGTSGTWECRVVETTSGAGSSEGEDADGGFEEAAASAARDLQAYVDAVAGWRDERTPAADLAAYVLWSATVAPEGFLRRESVLMSKHWMDKVWSWDHCFNALALAPGLVDEAVDQLLVPFDHQDEAGALPDSVTHSEVLYNFVKPPVHGWALRRLRATAARPLTRDELETVHAHLVRWSTFWLRSRRDPGTGLPYYQHGNDSGWDNATVFDDDRVLVAPDLTALLAVQLDVLGDLADELGHAAVPWRLERDRLVSALVEQLWSGDGFVGVGAHNGRRSSGTSLLTVLPLVLGNLLPADVSDRLAARALEHLTDHGLATEPVSSPHYEDDGYWRGPIWAPSTCLVEDGLRRSGHAALADLVSARFRALCEGSGFAENFDARTGAGLRDRAYTWTAAVYLLLSREHVQRAPR